MEMDIFFWQLFFGQKMNEDMLENKKEEEEKEGWEISLEFDITKKWNGYHKGGDLIWGDIESFIRFFFVFLKKKKFGEEY